MRKTIRPDIMLLEVIRPAAQIENAYAATSHAARIPTRTAGRAIRPPRSFRLTAQTTNVSSSSIYIYQSSLYVYSPATVAAVPTDIRSAPESAIPRKEITKQFAIPSTATDTAQISTENRMLPVSPYRIPCTVNKKTNVRTSAILFSSKI